MDHLLANSDNPVPDPSTQSSAGPGCEEVDGDDHDAVTAHIKKMGTASDADLVPRVRPPLPPFQTDL
jgi:hypothetical protein